MTPHPNDKQGEKKIRKMRSRYQERGWLSSPQTKHERRWHWLALELSKRGS